MKQLLLYILFFFSAISLVDAPLGMPVYTGAVAVESAGSGESMVYAADAAHDQVITVCIAANNYADVSGLQSHHFGSQFARRYRPGDIPGKHSSGLLPEQNQSSGAYRMLCCRNMEYSAVQKSNGYYLYALCRIII